MARLALSAILVPRLVLSSSLRHPSHIGLALIGLSIPLLFGSLKGRLLIKTWPSKP